MDMSIISTIAVEIYDCALYLTQQRQIVHKLYIVGLVQDCSNSSGLAMDLLQSYAWPAICKYMDVYIHINYKSITTKYDWLQIKFSVLL